MSLCPGTNKKKNNFKEEIRTWENFLFLWFTHSQYLNCSIKKSAQDGCSLEGTLFRELLNLKFQIRDLFNIVGTILTLKSLNNKAYTLILSEKLYPDAIRTACHEAVLPASILEETEQDTSLLWIQLFKAFQAI